MRFHINIGNTHTQIAVLRDGEPQLLAQLDTPDLANGHRTAPLFSLAAAEDAPDDWDAVVSSVVPAAARRLADDFGPRIRLLTARHFPQLDFSLVNTSTLGIDRICNAAAALELAGDGPLAVLDCGTCLSAVAIDRQRHFRSGAIAPGRLLLRQALHDHTAQLPLVPIDHDQQDIQPLAACTRDVIAAGTDIGAVGARERIATLIRQQLDAPEAPVFATGGDAPFFLRHLPHLLTPAPPMLTLRGTAVAKA